MSKKISTQQSFDFISGQIVTLKLICAATISLHPRKNDMIKLGKEMLKNAIENNASESYKDGIKDILGAVDEMLYSVLPVEQARKKGFDKVRD